MKLADRMLALLPAEYADLAKVMGGIFSRNLLRGIFRILIAGFLTPRAMGIMRSVVSLFKILAGLADLGLDYAMVTFVAAAIGRNDREEERQVFKTVLVLKIAIAAAFLVAGNIFAKPIAAAVLGDPALTVYVRLSVLAVGGQLLWKYVSSVLSARQDFGRTAFFLSTMPVLMLLAALILIAVRSFNMQTCVLVTIFAPAVTAALWWPALKLDLGTARWWNGKLARRIVGFGRWIYLTNASSTARNHLNPLLLKSPRLSGSVAAGEADAGLYGFGNDLANEITVLSESLLTVLLPKASARDGRAELRAFLKRSYKHLAFLVVPFALLMFLAEPLVRLLGHFKAGYLDYLPSLPAFMILYAGALFSIVSIPVKTVLYSMRKPQVETYLEMVMTFVMVIGGVLLIPRYGCTGAAIVVFFQRFVSCIVMIVYGMMCLKEPAKEKA